MPKSKKDHILFILIGALVFWGAWHLWEILELKGAKGYKSRGGPRKDRALRLLELMEPSRKYTQRELAELSSIPYRSVRRYVDKLAAVGYVKVEGRARAARVIRTK